ncbi:hypothetical protein D9M68_975790 [compost metagenome]
MARDTPSISSLRLCSLKKLMVRLSRRPILSAGTCFMSMRVPHLKGGMQAAGASLRASGLAGSADSANHLQKRMNESVDY